MHKVVVYFNSTLHHFSQLLAGLEFLNNEKRISLHFNLELGKYPSDIFKIEIDGLKVFFDLSDNSRIYKNIYEESDFYVKRMLLKSDAEVMEKLIPYGLYYPVYFKNNRLKYLFLGDSSLLKYSLKYWRSISRIFDIKDSIAVNEISLTESGPSSNSQIIFRARLWNPANNDTGWKKKERNILNQQRTELNRLLKNRFDSEFKGGILRDSYSRVVCPDLLLAENEYHRKVYLKELKNSSIGIVNQGLEDSIGAKMGEYVANSLAILTTSIDKYKIPGNFSEGSNYLTFTTAAECLELAEKLLSDSNLRMTIQTNNENYYAEYLHPGKKIDLIIKTIDLAQ